MAKSIPNFSPGHIKTRQLQLLVQLQQAGSVFHAAQALGMSQSAASRLLTSLESDIGVQLFERHARGMVPTAYGAIVTSRAAAALAELVRAGEEVEALARSDRVPVSIGSLLSPSSTYLPTALLQLARSAPEILVNVHVDTSRALVEGLMSARFDLVLARVRDASLEPELSFEPLTAEPLSVVVRAGHPLARKRKLVLADLVGQPWVLPPRDTDLRMRLDALCVQRGLPLPSGLIESISVPVVMGMLRMSDALAMLPTEFARPYCGEGWLAILRVDLGVRSENFGIITRRRRAKPPQLKHALQIFRETAHAFYSVVPSSAAT